MDLKWGRLQPFPVPEIKEPRLFPSKRVGGFAIPEVGFGNYR